MSVAISAYKRCSVRLYLQLVVGGLMSYLRVFLCLLENSGVQHILCFLFVLFFFVWSLDGYCVLFLRCFSSPMLPVSMNFPFFFITTSVLSNVHCLDIIPSHWSKIFCIIFTLRSLSAILNGSYVMLIIFNILILYNIAIMVMLTLSRILSFPYHCAKVYLYLEIRPTCNKNVDI